MDPRPGTTYEHSGRFSIEGALAVVATAVVAGSVLGYAYGYVCDAISWGRVKVFIFTSLAAVIGGAVGRVTVWAKVRNGWIAAPSGLLAGVVALYVSWLVVLAAVRATDFGWMPPLEVWDEIILAAETESHSPVNKPISSWMAYTVWWTEAAGLAVMSLGTVWTLLDKHPFCERCNRWAKETETLARVDVPLYKDAFEQDFEKRGIEALLGLSSRVSPLPEGSYGELTLRLCGQCRQLLVLSFEEVKVKRRRGKLKRSADDIIDGFVITHAERHTIEKRFAASIATPPEE